MELKILHTNFNDQQKLVVVLIKDVHEQILIQITISVKQCFIFEWFTSDDIVFIINWKLVVMKNLYSLLIAFFRLNAVWLCQNAHCSFPCIWHIFDNSSCARVCCVIHHRQSQKHNAISCFNILPDKVLNKWYQVCHSYFRGLITILNIYILIDISAVQFWAVYTASSSAKVDLYRSFCVIATAILFFSISEIEDEKADLTLIILY